MAAIPSYRAAMVGLSERDRTLLRSLLAATQARTGRRWDGGPGQPQVYFIDIDRQAGVEFWQSLAEDERRDSVIVLSSAPPAAVTHWLPKPLRSVSLLGVLEQMTLPVRAPALAPATATTGAGPATSARAAVRLRNANEPLALLDVFDEPSATTARVMQSSHWPDLVVGSGNTHVMRTASVDRYIEIPRHRSRWTESRNTPAAHSPTSCAWTSTRCAGWRCCTRRSARSCVACHGRSARLRAAAFGHLPHTLQRITHGRVAHAASRVAARARRHDMRRRRGRVAFPRRMRSDRLAGGNRRNGTRVRVGGAAGHSWRNRRRNPTPSLDRSPKRHRSSLRPRRSP